MRRHPWPCRYEYDDALAPVQPLPSFLCWSLSSHQTSVCGRRHTGKCNFGSSKWRIRSTLLRWTSSRGIWSSGARERLSTKLKIYFCWVCNNVNRKGHGFWWGTFTTVFNRVVHSADSAVLLRDWRTCMLRSPKKHSQMGNVGNEQRFGPRFCFELLQQKIIAWSKPSASNTDCRSCKHARVSFW